MVFQAVPTVNHAALYAVMFGGLSLCGYTLIQDQGWKSSMTRIWLLGILLTSFGINLGYTLAAMAFGFWLMYRFSNITPLWGELAVRVVAGWLILAGLALSVVGITAYFIPLAYMIYAAHSYRALSDRNTTRTLSAHWFSLGIICFLLGAGILGAFLSHPDLAGKSHHLALLRDWLISWGVLAFILGGINQIGAELRQENRRITGLLPYWLVMVGVLGGSLAWSYVGVLTAYTDSGFESFYAWWRLAQWLICGGMVIYILGLIARSDVS